MTFLYALGSVAILATLISRIRFDLKRMRFGVWRSYCFRWCGNHRSGNAPTRSRLNPRGRVGMGTR